MKTEVSKHIYIETEEFGWLKIYGTAKKLHRSQKG